MLGKGLMCWGKVHCVGEKFNVLGKGSLCWGKVHCVRKGRSVALRA